MNMDVIRTSHTACYLVSSRLASLTSRPCAESRYNPSPPRRCPNTAMSAAKFPRLPPGSRPKHAHTSSDQATSGPVCARCPRAPDQAAAFCHAVRALQSAPVSRRCDTSLAQLIVPLLPLRFPDASAPSTLPASTRSPRMLTTRVLACAAAPPPAFICAEAALQTGVSVLL